MVEHEIRFRVPDTMADAVLAEMIRISGERAVTSLRAVYFDTAGRDLAAAGIGLRLRREGTDWVQTAKTASADGLSRLEHNLPRDEACLDLPAFAGRKGLEALGDATALARLQDTLVAVFETDIERRRTVVRTYAQGERGVIEIAFDRGRLIAGGRRAPVCELEFELLGGDLDAIWAVAEPWVARFGLTALPAGKAERGHRLRSGGAPPCVRAGDIHARPDDPVQHAYARAFDDCYRQIAINASSIVVGTANDEHVHQLRVGLRRLRVMLRLFEAWVEPVPPDTLAALVDAFRALGKGRDRDVYRGEILPAIMSAGGDAPAPEALFAGRVPDLAAVCSASAFQIGLLRLQRHRHRLGIRDGGGALSSLARPRVAAWAKAIGKRARRFDRATVDERHDLRKRIKRLRYAVDLLAPLLPRRWRSIAKSMARAQQSLGRWCDLNMARERLRETEPDGFAHGWAVAKIEICERGLSGDMKRLARVIDKALR
ncbi:MAG: CHAD domain-containing protein [Burkholderiaceae bacterium]